jgi:uncharacterized membrane protein
VSDTEAGQRRGTRSREGLDTPVPRTKQRARLRIRRDADPERFGRLAERFARFMGTARFLVYMTAFVAVWLLWNTLAPASAQFDPRALNYTLLTLILSLQASYAAPLILLAQNRQDDRDRVQNAQDRAAAERALADTEFLTREVADLKIALREVATRDFLRSELRSLLEDLEDRRDESADPQDPPRDRSRDKPRGKGGKKARDKHRDRAPALPDSEGPTHPDEPDDATDPDGPDEPADPDEPGARVGPPGDADHAQRPDDPTGLQPGS